MNIHITLLLLLTISLEISDAKRKKPKADKSESKVNGMDSMICPPCDRLFCTVRKESRLKCRGGTTTDICGCCPVCAKQVGEPCGGEWNYLGKCDAGLYCKAATISLLQPNTFYPQIKLEVPNGMAEGTCDKRKYYHTERVRHVCISIIILNSTCCVSKYILFNHSYSDVLRVDPLWMARWRLSSK